MKSQVKRNWSSHSKPPRTIMGRTSLPGTAAEMPDSTRNGETAEVGSTRTHPRSFSQTSVQAWASAWRTIR